MSLLSKNHREDYTISEYVRTAREDAKRAAKEIIGAILLGIILAAFCVLMGVM